MWEFPTGIPAEFLSDCEANESSYENICRNCRKLTAKIAAHYVCKAQTSGYKFLSQKFIQKERCKNRLCNDCLLVMNSKSCSYMGCLFRFCKSNVFILTNDLTSLVFKCPEKLCAQKLHYGDFITHTHSLPKKNSNDKLKPVEIEHAEAVFRDHMVKERADSMSSINIEKKRDLENEKMLLSEKLRHFADELEKQEAKENALNNEEIENLKNLVSFQEKKINELMSDASDHAKTVISLANENESLANENKSLKQELEKAQDEISKLQNIKEEHIEMSNMFGRFNIEWMESKGELFFSQFRQLFQVYHQLARSARRSTTQTSIFKLR